MLRVVLALVLAVIVIGILVYIAVTSLLPRAVIEHMQEVSMQTNVTVVKIVEWYPEECTPVKLIKVIDGDTVRVKLPDGTIERVRLVGYNAYELKEPGGVKAKRVVESLLTGREICLKVDKYEPHDKYGRLLGYIWYKVDNAYCPLVKIILLKYRKQVVKYPLHVGIDEYPYWIWSQKVPLTNILRQCKVEIRGSYIIEIHNCTGVYKIRQVESVYVTRGVYKVYINDREVCTIDLISGLAG